MKLDNVIYQVGDWSDNDVNSRLSKNVLPYRDTILYISYFGDLFFKILL